MRHILEAEEVERGKEMKQQRVLLIIDPNLAMGGVGENAMRWMEYYAKQGVRVIWLASDPTQCFPTWKKVLDDCGVEIVTPDHYLDLNLDGAWVTAVSFFIRDYIFLSSLLSFYTQADIHIFYMIPNLKDQIANFMEVDYDSPQKETVIAQLAPIHQRMDAQGRLLFAHPEHITTIEEAYGGKVLQPKERLMARLSEKIIYEQGLANSRCESRKESFRIITCGRFDFPYKGYIIGLVREYALLKPRYPQLKLEIIGGGSDEQELLDVIASLSPEITEDITLHGMVDYKDLKGYFDQCHLNVGTGGAVRDGAITGIPSIPVTDISAYTCEVSGFFLGDKSIWSITTNPMDLKPLIVQAIEATEEDYLHLCRKAYDTFAEEYQGRNQNWLLDQRNQEEAVVLDEDLQVLLNISFGFVEKQVEFVTGKTCQTNEKFQQLVEKMSKGQPCYLWGAGMVGERIFRYFHDKINIVGFIDSSVEKQKGTFCGFPVMGPSFLERERPIVVVATEIIDISKSIWNALGEYGYHFYENSMDVNSLYLAGFQKREERL